MKSTKESTQPILGNGKVKFCIYSFLVAFLVKLLFRTLGLGFELLYIQLAKEFLPEVGTTVLYYSLLLISCGVYLKIVRGRKKWRYVLLVGLIPMDIFILLTYTTSTIAVMVIGIVLMVIMGVLSVMELLINLEIAESRGRVIVWRKFFRHFMKKQFQVMGIMLTVIMLSYVTEMVPFAVKEAGWFAQEEEASEEAEEGSVWERNADKLICLSESNYANLGFEERVEALQVVVDMEMEYLGCADRGITLVTEEMSGGVAGYFSNRRNVIAIDKNVVEEKSAEYAIYILLHESYHVYQQACCESLEALDLSKVNTELRFYKDILKWQEEFDDYHNGSDAESMEEMELYASQSVEMTAEEYSEKWIKPLIYFIEQLVDAEKESGEE